MSDDRLMESNRKSDGTLEITIPLRIELKDGETVDLDRIREIVENKMYDVIRSAAQGKQE